ncbi:MAG: efflux RND transporter permease subunit [Pseudomonadota bacterium]
MTSPTDEIGHPRGVVAFFAAHRNAANLLMVMMLLFGIVGVMRMNTQFFPSLEVPTVTISIAWSGASAEDVESNILDAVEPEVRFVDGLKEMISYAREGAGTIRLEFDQGTDMQRALADVETAVAGVTILPDGSEDPVVTGSTWYETVAKLALSGPFSEDALRAIARDIRDDLIDAGIDRVVMDGFRDREILIEVSETDLQRLGLSIDAVAGRVSQALRDSPSGTLDGPIERQLRSAEPPATPTDIAAIDVLSLNSGETVTLGEIAEVRTAYDDDAAIGYSGGTRAIELTIQRSRTADTLETAAIFNAYLEDLRVTLPETLDISVYEVAADRLSDRIFLLVENGLTGLALVVIVLFVFLNARVALWVAVGIPTAVMATLGLMWATGQTINMISLFALIMMLGIIVDDAIVVGEETATLYAKHGRALQAASNGAERMFWPVIAATLTTIAAFFPLFLVSDTVGQIMHALPFVVIVALIASVIESFFILPGHLHHSLDGAPPRETRFRRAVDSTFNAFRWGPHLWLARLSVRWRYAVVALTVASFLIALGMVTSGRVGFQFFPSPESENVRAGISFAAGTPRTEVEAAILQIEAALADAEAELTNGTDERLVTATYAVIGQLGFSRGMNLAEINVQLTSSEVRTIRTSDIVTAWRAAAPDLPGVDRLTIATRRGGPPGRDVDIRLTGAEPEVLKQAALVVRDLLATYPGISGIADDLPFGKPEVLLSLTPRGSALGFTLEDVGRQVRSAFDGAIAHRFADGEDEVVVRVERVQSAPGLAGLLDLTLVSPDGIQVPITSIVSLTERQGFSAIQRFDGKTTVSVTADVDTDIATPVEMVAALQAGPLAETLRPFGVEFTFSGRDEERREAFGDLQTGALIALAVIFLILAWVFASYSLPLAVISIIPFGFVGAVLGHWLMGFPLTILSMMGLLGLSGILVNDSIILVKRMCDRMDEGEDVYEAAAHASCDRLRAVLLTSLTTIGGLGPLMFEQSLQAQFLLPMAITLVFGLAVATLFVLFLVPAIVGIGADIRRLARLLYGPLPLQPAE